MRVSSPFLVLIALASLGGCADFPELEVSEAEFDRTTPYPDLVPLDELLEEPEPTITDELQDTLTTRRDDLLATPSGADSDPLLERLEALRKKRDEKLVADPEIDEELRKRLEGGITAPTEPE
ncbi:hypothetical protein [Planktotalea sp.]|uniref:hypothetical protein n=1 Tax=Planktotalea sp. TaxID=2029877 RepID=UPI00329A0E43